MSRADQDLPVFYCSFCGQSYDNVEYWIMGPDVSICSDCADHCTYLLKEWRKAKKAKRKRPTEEKK